jgi:hypothetical protein
MPTTKSQLQSNPIPRLLGARELACENARGILDIRIVIIVAGIRDAPLLTDVTAIAIYRPGKDAVSIPFARGHISRKPCQLNHLPCGSW